MYNVYSAGEDDALKELDGFDYWNNEEEEKAKEFDIRNGDFEKLERYLFESHLSVDLERAIEYSGIKLKNNIVGTELAGGVCWTAPILFKNVAIQRMDYLDYSQHRIGKIAPLILNHYNIPDEKVRLYRGSFYETGFGDKEYDFVLLSQALHHAEYIGDLLIEINRILKDDGVVIIIGEPRVHLYDFIKYRIYLLYLQLFHPDTEPVRLYKENYCLYHDKILGDRNYYILGYKKIFKRYGFSTYMTLGNNEYTFLLKKSIQ
jgi:ubiquinone/menaquinone biosynthesis C-methylase UbiE